MALITINGKWTQKYEQETITEQILKNGKQVYQVLITLITKTKSKIPSFSTIEGII